MSDDDDGLKAMGQVIQIDETRIWDHLGEMVRGTVEETLNALLDTKRASSRSSQNPCLAGHHARVRGSGEKCLEPGRNWLKITGYRTKKVVHSGGHKPPSAFLPKPYFAGFLERARPSVENPSLSATLKQLRESPVN